jgi:hypothetical protein
MAGRLPASMGAAVVGAVVTASGLVAAADPPAIRAEVACEPASGPGKIRCEVTITPVGGRLLWADAIVLAAPPFVPPLRNRAASTDGRRDPAGARLPLALAATADGSGTLKVRARAVVCVEGACRPVAAEASTEVVVGARGDGGAARHAGISHGTPESWPAGPAGAIRGCAHRRPAFGDYAR